MVCIQKVCPKTLRDHLAVQASSIDSPEKQKVTIEKFLQANVHGSGASPMDVDALAKAKGGKKGDKGGGKGGKPEKFDGDCDWCGKHGHKQKDCWAKAAGKPKVPKSQRPRSPDKRAKGGGKGDPAKGKKGAGSLDEWPGDGSPSANGDRNPNDVAGGLFIGVVDKHRGYTKQDWQAWSDIQKQARHQWKAYKDRSLDANAVDAEAGERLDLTIDSGCAACGLPPNAAAEVSMQELSGPPQEYIAANAEKIRELGLKTPTLKFQNGDVESLKFRVMDKLHKPLVAASKVVAANNRIVLQPEKHGGSYIEDLTTKRRKRVFERNGVYVLPCWVVKQNPAKRLAPLDHTCPNDRQVYL